MRLAIWQWDSGEWLRLFPATPCRFADLPKAGTFQIASAEPVGEPVLSVAPILSKASIAVQIPRAVRLAPTPIVVSTTPPVAIVSPPAEFWGEGLQQVFCGVCERIAWESEVNLASADVPRCCGEPMICEWTATQNAAFAKASAPSVLSDTNPIAGLDHHFCTRCHNEISKGDTYRRLTYSQNGVLETEKICWACDSGSADGSACGNDDWRFRLTRGQ